jgi:hypothetical protein
MRLSDAKRILAKTSGDDFPEGYRINNKKLIT